VQFVRPQYSEPDFWPGDWRPHGPAQHRAASEFRILIVAQALLPAGSRLISTPSLRACSPPIRKERSRFVDLLRGIVRLLLLEQSNHFRVKIPIWRLDTKQVMHEEIVPL